jgi:hypothetical protein
MGIFAVRLVSVLRTTLSLDRAKQMEHHSAKIMQELVIFMIQFGMLFMLLNLLPIMDSQ